jgi:4-diphosphocytidyl-2-C-methyl-D-erythritol kinase
MAGEYAAAIAGSNLVDTALDRVAAADPQAILGRVEVEKRLPIAAGIGGGSADAAAVLRAVRRANPAASIAWHSISASLGADVPVCLADRTSLVWGIGEHIEPAAQLPRLDAVLVCPLSASPFGKTKSVFKQLSLPEAAEAERPARLPAFTDAAALVDYMRAIGNDLRAPAHAVLPDSAAAEAALAALPDCRYVGLSGAGPTSYGIFADAQRAGAAAEQLRARHPNWWVIATTLGD